MRCLCVQVCVATFRVAMQARGTPMQSVHNVLASRTGARLFCLRGFQRPMKAEKHPVLMSVSLGRPEPIIRDCASMPGEWA